MKYSRPMIRSRGWLLPLTLLVCWSAFGIMAHAQDGSDWPSDHERQIVSIGHDAELGKGETAESVVAVLGSAKVEGDVADSVVAVVGDTHVTGHVGEDAVAVLGDTYVNSKVDGNVVAVLGNLTLGPQAVVEGQVVEILGTVDRSPGAVVEGGTVGVLAGLFNGAGGLHEWVRHSLIYARPLAPTAAIGWAWGIALATLAFYLLLAVLFHDGLQRCVRTLDAHPGPSILAALIATLLVPVLMMVLAVTVVGIALIPFVWVGLFCAGLFGRVVALGWLGSRCFRLINVDGARPMVLAVLLGGIIALALYMIPVLGFIVYGLIGIVGFGALVYTLLLAAKAARERPAPGGPRPAAPGAGPSAGDVPPPSPGPGTPGTSAHEPAGSSPGGSAPEPGASAYEPAGPAYGHGGAAAHGPGAAPSSGGPQPGPARGPSQSPGDWWNTPAVDPHVAATYPRAGFWTRIGALLIDLVLVGIALSLFYHGFRATLLILATYAAIMWKLRGTTVGGIVCDLQVARLDGRPIDWGTAIVRALACFLSLAVLGLGFLWIAIDPDHQAWHDKIAGTVVVRVAKRVAAV